ncbi:hypothetical protein SRB521_01937 [Intestinimonas butyriciproducens]|nr:hypothetical protein SRB521_01937 [Intestinimonas butyriciproducens]
MFRVIGTAGQNQQAGGTQQKKLSQKEGPPFRSQAYRMVHL